MKIICLAFLAITFFSSCGVVFKDHQKLEGGRKYNSTNPVFLSYVGKFEQQGKTHTGDPGFVVGDIPINFDTDLPGGDVKGVCNEYSDGTKEILIKESWWNSVDDGFRESLLYHELGHCRLGRDHKDDMINIGNSQFKKSMMHSYIVNSSEYIMHQNDYFRELFTNDTSSLINSLTISVSRR